MTRPQREYDAAVSLIKQGVNDCEIARRLSIPRSTIRDWRRPSYIPLGFEEPVPPGIAASRVSACSICGEGTLDGQSYSYLLGLYLGDGYIVLTGSQRAHRLSITLDIRYIGIIDECYGAMSSMKPRGRMKVHFVHAPGCVAVTAYWKHWTCLFPQHGPGPKHLREVTLRPWQQAVVDSYPRAFLRGLIHSDGCRSVNRVVVRGKTYRYPRYQLTNESMDIHMMFRRTCGRLGVGWTASPRQTYVSRRKDVAYLDTFIGPKR